MKTDRPWQRQTFWLQGKRSDSHPFLKARSQMALTLKYRNGFIDAEDETVSGPAALQRRASSLPPRMSKMVQVEEFLQEEEGSIQPSL